MLYSKQSSIAGIVEFVLGKIFRLRGKATEPEERKTGDGNVCPKCAHSFERFKLRKNRKGETISRHCPICGHKIPPKKPV